MAILRRRVVRLRRGGVPDSGGGVPGVPGEPQPVGRAGCAERDVALPGGLSEHEADKHQPQRTHRPGHPPHLR